MTIQQMPNSLETIDAHIKNLRQQVEEAEEAKKELHKNALFKKKLDRWRAVIFRVDIDYVRCIEDIYEHVNLSSLIAMVDLSKFYESQPGCSFSMTVEPIFE